MPLRTSVDSLVSRLKLRHLRIVVALSELGSLARVAERFHVSPAAISKTLAEIEEIAGAELFERGRRGMHPTELGEEVIRCATFVGAQLTQMAEFVQSTREGTRGRLTIAYRTLSVQPLLAQAVCEFHEANPLVSVNVAEGAVDDLIDQITEGELDLLFAYKDPRFERSELLSTPVVNGQRLVVVASPGHPLLRSPKISAEALTQQQWVLPAWGSRLQYHLEAAFQAHDLQAPTRGIRTSDVPMTLYVLRNANFLAVLPARIAAQLVSAGMAKTLRFDLASRVEPVMVVRNAVLRPRRSAAAFIDFIMRRAKHAGLLTTDVRHEPAEIGSHHG
ncbi:LysR family transcriptional regulator [Variovorax sp. PBL-E5]|uniref:LysR family transcriptional regulator n=1 Tax=Variovorax sp. PBL-E5 TaxID=434014 RepID=UPI0013167443|nr:LysR family transcriptional regulator [Variovorax sp. PBL-E5]VTU17569.1 Galactose-binding protein regulator [Variovorax sp. PBL-E5]